MAVDGVAQMPTLLGMEPTTMPTTTSTTTTDAARKAALRKALKSIIKPLLVVFLNKYKTYKKAAIELDKAQKHWNYYIGEQGNPYLDPVALKRIEVRLENAKAGEFALRNALRPIGDAIRASVKNYKAAHAERQ